jgi:hypothetical protein
VVSAGLYMVRRYSGQSARAEREEPGERADAMVERTRERRRRKRWTSSVRGWLDGGDGGVKRTENEQNARLVILELDS